MTTPPPTPPRTSQHEERYQALRTVAALIRVLAFEDNTRLTPEAVAGRGGQVP
jgi:hypothetical protein